MRGCRNAATVFVFSVFNMLCVNTPCLANPIYYPGPPDYAFLAAFFFVIPFLFTAIIESAVTRAALWNSLGRWWRVPLAVSLVNLITFPLTQLAWLPVIRPGEAPSAGFNLFIMIVLWEVAVILAEYLLLGKCITRWWRRGLFEKEVSNLRLMCAVTAANATSFAAGFIVVASVRPPF